MNSLPDLSDWTPFWNHKETIESRLEKKRVICAAFDRIEAEKENPAKKITVTSGGFTMTIHPPLTKTTQKMLLRLPGKARRLMEAKPTRERLPSYPHKQKSRYDLERTAREIYGTPERAHD